MEAKISVLMPVLNGNKEHLQQSIDSILNQTFSDFEFLIVDDGSNAETKHFLDEQANKDERIRIITNDANIGVGKSLNRGLAVAKGEYIARHDADDNAKPNRFQVQLNYMETNPQVGLSCSAVNHIDMQGEYIGGHPCSTDSQLLVAELLLNSRLCHPSLMIRTKILRELGGYPLTKSAQDYLLYLKLIKHQYTFGGIDECLVDYRINTESITRKNRSKQLNNAENGSYEHVVNVVGEIDRSAFSRFWYYVASQGNTKIKLIDMLRVRPVLKLIKRDPCYRKAWLGPMRWISRNSLDQKPSLTNLLVAVYFRYIL